jgi:hypothetical protein
MLSTQVSEAAAEVLAKAIQLICERYPAAVRGEVTDFAKQAFAKLNFAGETITVERILCYYQQHHIIKEKANKL